ncbi:MAG: AraC family transcriptional regulator [Chloroflexota bacterium]
MSDFFSIPEQAINTFEKWSQLYVFVWDLEREHFYPYLSPQRINSSYPCCTAIQNSALDHKCTFFERKYVFERLGKHPEGVTKVCHAGLVEWCIPIFLERRIVTILYAGQHTRSPNLAVDLYDPQPTTDAVPFAGNLQLPQPVSAERTALISEGLRQLAARLTLWLIETSVMAKRPFPSPRKNDLITRRNLILNFVHEHHTEPISLQALADHLHLSHSRVSHVVREACGQSFSKLITEARIRSSLALLQHTKLPISEVAVRCGFQEPSYFFKCFKTAVGTTPRAYREHNRRLGRVS